MQLRSPVSGARSLVGRAADLFMAADGTKVHGSQLGAGLQQLLATTRLGVIRQVLFQQIDPLRWKVLVDSGGGFNEALAAQLCKALAHKASDSNGAVAAELSRAYRFTTVHLPFSRGSAHACIDYSVRRRVAVRSRLLEDH